MKILFEKKKKKKTLNYVLPFPTLPIVKGKSLLLPLHSSQKSLSTFAGSVTWTKILKQNMAFKPQKFAV